jgi:hypothetical protein
MEKSLMTGPIIQTGPSLLPYVDPGKAGLRLRLSGSGHHNGGQPALLPVMEAAGPFASIVEGTLTAGGSRGLADVFLLVQPDVYPAASSELMPVTNVDIEHLWQSGSARVRALCQDDFTPLLPEQVDAQGRAVPWRSLFYCRHKARYGHPLCPRCGGALTLCRDDRTLLDAGLPGYSSSLSRFLDCPACRRTSETPLFYARLVPPGHPADLIGCDQLIEGFSRLLTRQDLAGELPCVGCDQASDCYGPQTLVHQRMRPLFFYPFFMLLQPAPTLNVLEFLELLSGAAFDQVAARLARQQKPGRLDKWRRCRQRLASGDGLLFRQAEKSFAEVLYLKLTLLDELFDIISQATGHLAEPVAGMSLESLWVRLPAQTARLPLFWNFSLHLIDAVGRPDPDAVPGPLARARTRAFLGAAWCHALLVNERQDMQAVQKALDKVLADPPEATAPDQAPAWCNEPVFDAANLLYQPPEAPIATPLRRLWNRALGLGLDLLRAGRAADKAWSDESFRRQCATLRQEVHTALFHGPETAAADAPPVRRPEDQHIASIVRTLLAQWPQEPFESAATAAPAGDPGPEQTREQPIPDDDGDFQETVILGAEGGYGAQAPALEETMMVSARAQDGETQGRQDDLQATVHIPTDPATGKGPPAPGDEDLEKTVIAPPRPAAPGAEDDLEATVIMDGGAQSGAKPRAAPPRPPTPDGAPVAAAKPSGGDADDDLAQTVIMRSEKTGGRKPKP